ncbi:hypothetical protein GLOIN_2v1483741 [Rhizophagus irregularis DAOM 181602=DAOM 197198]|uniref:Uncharacterized protein n=1 Tax=Rhizophagus irregularis (strain DAOM 181602 / DAOM 197198 / MUCL 43194) TaxID=747089 RepID=A0A2P4PGV3_RHIID|nr:hypothetical protein GLOIN_2v1483741 [Rhizophagus irregularis DAOM 181602=DAOM 197198]POG64619.1 hypothetical protein GLOIN_2v1483741 [Rhizophagus irregularis DAOM 181602=DAOM 197198]|eukprot:XP_025171485.1 hypothetical protein GLOIN_2v1483741 [Rhizophagus irregularis DAOM 181602=DAOM 197198]
MLELDLGESVKYKIANIKYKVRGPAETYLIGNSNLKLDISDSISYLTEQGYHIKKYRISQRSTRDYSNIEVKSIKKIFSGMTAGEQECQKFYFAEIKALTGPGLIWQSRLKIRIGPVWVNASTQTKIFGLVWSDPGL